MTDYIRDNPFRLLNIASRSDVAVLRSAGKAALASARVGLSTAPPFSAEFGDDAVSRLDQIIKACSVDTELRTAFRFAWPIGEQGDSAKTSSQLQSRFLDDWAAFVSRHDPLWLSSALAAWQALYTDENFDHFLADLLVTEEGMPKDTALDVVIGAQELVGRQVLEEAATAVVSAFRSGKLLVGQSLVHVILASPMDDHWEELALRPVVDYCRGLASQFDDSRSQKWSPVWIDTFGPNAKVLTLVAGEIDERYPIAGEWVEKITNYYDLIAILARNWAVDAHNNSGSTGASIEAIRKVSGLPVSSAVAKKLAEDLATLNKMRTGTGLAASPQAERVTLSNSCLAAILIPIFSVIVAAILISSNWSSWFPPSAEPYQGEYATPPPPKSYYSNDGPPVPAKPKGSSLPRVEKPVIKTEQEQPKPPPPREPVALPNDSDIVTPRGPVGRGTLTIENGDDRDAAVKLAPIDGGSRRYVYIRKGMSGQISRIASGNYRVLVRMGIDWDRANLKFLQNESLSKFLHEFLFEERVEETDTQITHHYSTWSVTLYRVEGGNAQSTPADEEEFGD